MINKYEPRLRDWKITAALAAVIFLVWNIFIILSSSLEFSQEVIIKESQGISAIAKELKEKGVINNKFIFVLYTLATGNEKKLQAGRYIFQPGNNIPTIVYNLANGLAESEDITITIPEGFNVFDIDKRIASLGFIKEGEFVNNYHKGEGQFFPDTYRLHNFQTNSNGQKIKHDDVIKELIEKMARNFDIKSRELLGRLSQEKQKEVIIIASMLEKEAKTEKDMRLIAGVIEKRRDKGIPLQIDATVSYGACFRNIEMSIYQNIKYKSCDISLVPVGTEIKIDGPYNTYTRTGFPFGPISNPGVTAIRAALNPVKSDYLYYLSTRDGSQIVFSETAVEHAANRKKYLGI